MIIYNNCSTKAKTNSIPLYELMIWLTSLIQCKKLGYETKLYCSKDDIEYLKSHHLYDLYDYIDDETLDNSENLKKINKEKFWSTIKLEAINHELQLNPTSIYSDTDVVLFEKLESPCDNIFWTIEGVDKVYMDWDNLSKPKDYELSEYIKNTSDAYNCGIMKFKDYELFKKYYDEYYKFAIDNPCKLDFYDYQNNVYACNSEQRILKAVIDNSKTTTDIVCPWDFNGLCNHGIHIFIYKVLWKKMKYVNIEEKYYNELHEKLNSIKDLCMNIIKEYDKSIYDYLMSFDYFKTELDEFK